MLKLLISDVMNYMWFYFVISCNEIKMASDEFEKSKQPLLDFFMTSRSQENIMIEKMISQIRGNVTLHSFVNIVFK